MFTYGPDSPSAGEPFSYDGVKSAWRRAKKAAGITNFRIHDLRHTAATQLLLDTGNLAFVQRMLRHARVSTTMKYAHVQVDALRAAMDAQIAAPSPEQNPEPQPNVLKLLGGKNA